MHDRRVAVAATALLVLTACGGTPSGDRSAEGPTGLGAPGAAEQTSAGSHEPNPDQATGTTVPASTEPTTTTTTTTTVPALDVHDPSCVVQVARGESLGLIADRFDDDAVRLTTIRAENNLDSDVIHPGQLLDVCVDNGLDDITGEQRLEPNAVLAEEATRRNVEVQQAHLNVLFDGCGLPPLVVDGISGPVTRQRLCAARVAFDSRCFTTEVVFASALQMGHPAMWRATFSARAGSVISSST